ncbi:MAG: PQQ-binding-like beta-propeller repeat protein [Planctomycetales bacterium]|nr:PQQ-binding-like beta-propeller repeat protein [Planctomycetales bacterium]
MPTHKTGNCLSVGLLLLVGLNTAAYGADWPSYMNGRERIGATTESLPATPRLAWTFHSPEPPELAWEGPRPTPIEGHEMRHRVDFDRAMQTVSVGDQLFFGSPVDHRLHCLDAATGATRWTFDTDGPIRLAPTVWNGHVLFGSDDGHVYCLTTAGKLAWKLQAGARDERLLARGRMISRWPIRTGVLVDDGLAYFGAGVFPHETIYLYCVDAATGKVVWRNDHFSQDDAGRNPLSPQGYLLSNDQQLFVPSGRALPAAFEKSTGEEDYQRTHSWRTTAGGVVGGWKALLADGQLFSAGDHHFLALDQTSGAVGYAWISGYQLSLSDERGFVSDGERIAAMDRAKHIEATRLRQKLTLERYELQRKRTSMDAGEYREQVSELNQKIAELNDVGIVWSTKSPLASAMIVAGDLVIAGGEGRVAGYATSDGKEQWSFAVEGDARGLCLANGRLTVSTDAGLIYCFSASGDAPDKPAQHPGEAMANPYPRDELSEMYAKAAEEILQRSGATQGFCLVLGAEQGRLAYEIAKRSELRVYGIEPDEQKIAVARRAMNAAKLHGRRVMMVHGDPDNMPFSNYFANLVVSDTALLTGKVPVTHGGWARCVKPCGGVAMLGSAAAKSSLDSAQRATLITHASADSVGTEVQPVESTVAVVRGTLPGAGRWSHQYGDPANTMTSQDSRMKGGLGVLWYGDPGPSKMINRHEAAAAPLSTNGRMFIQGTDTIMCYDAYNGLFLWEVENKGALRTGVFNNEEPSNLAASDDALFVVVDDKCTEYDAATGKVRRVHQTPASPDKLPRVWGYVAVHNGKLYGTSTLRSDLEAALRRRGHTVKNTTDAIFAIDLKSGEQQWAYRGRNILHVTIAIGDGRVFFIDSSITKEEREELLRQDKSELKKLSPAEAQKKEAELKALDVRLAVAVDEASGELLWSKAVDVTDCSRVGIGGGELTLMYHDGHVLICGANANGHYWRQFLTGQFDQRRLLVLESETGKKLWSADANYRHRPIIIDQQVLAEPWSFDLHSGEQRTRENPLTGEQTAWQFSRPGHHCGPITATPNMLFFRSGFTGYYDLYSDSGTSHFAGHRLGCWVNAIPGNGLLMIPEASAGCVCQFSIASTIVMEPREDRNSWRIFSATGAATPVKQMHINFGGPGDRKDEFGNLWLAFPRPNTVGRLEYTLDLKPKLAAGGRFFANNDETDTLPDARLPWLYASGGAGLMRCEAMLLGKDDPAASYRVVLHFAEREPGTAPFEVKLQGETVARRVEIGEDRVGQAVLQEFKGVRVTGSLLIEVLADLSEGHPPTVCALEIHRED